MGSLDRARRLQITSSRKLPSLVARIPSSLESPASPRDCGAALRPPFLIRLLPNSLGHARRRTYVVLSNSHGTKMGTAHGTAAYAKATASQGKCAGNHGCGIPK